MHLKSNMRKLCQLTIIFPFIVLAGCWGNGSGPSSTSDAKREVVGALVNSPVSGAEWASGDESGLTVNGDYPYTEGDTVTFSVGGITLGVDGVTVDGARTLTPVELTGSRTPVEQAATNMFVFLQTIDENSPNSDDGILISAATRLAFAGQSLNFATDSVTFTNDFQALLDAVLPGTTIVSEEDALGSFCEDTYLPAGGANTFGYPFPGCEFASDAELLTNRSFESPDASAGDTVCSNGWACFNPVFTTSNLFDNGNQSPPAATGTQVLKMFGPFFDGGAAGANQDFTPVPNSEYSASVLAQNWTEAFPEPDPLDPTNLADLQLIFSSDGNFDDDVGEVSFEVFGSSDPALTEFTYLPPNEWVMLSVTGVAPEDAVAGRFQILHIQTGAEVTGGNVFYDDASLIGPPAVAPPPEDFELVWSDEFDVNGAPSAENWTAEIGYGDNGWGNNEWQYYTDDPANVRVENNMLVISAQCGTPGEGGTTVTVPVPNGGFESPDASGGDVPGAGTPWSSFNSNFTLNNTRNDTPPGTFYSPDAKSGVQLLKQFGKDAGSFQDFPASEGDTWEVSAWAQSWAGDENNNTGLLQVFFRDATTNLCDPGGFEPCGQVVFDTSQPVDTWVQLVASAVAPAGTTIVRIQLILVPDAGTPGGGSLWWDDVTLTTTTPGGPVECDAGVRDGTVTSARITTSTELGNGFDFRYGKIEARIQPPVGKAAWPAFWMLGSNFPEVGWPNSGEIDIMEMWNTGSSNPETAHSTMHWCGDEGIQQEPFVCSQGRVLDGGSLGFGSSLGDDFHIYTAIWDSSRIVFFVDDTQIFSRVIQPATMEEFTRDFFMILNVAMGGTLGSAEQPPDGTEKWPQTMKVDWVRVYKAVP
jgi:beta-glucanase (GH16 family)